MDETGALVSETISAHLWYLDRERPQSMLQNLDDWFYELQWERSERHGASTSSTGKNWLILADRLGFGEALAASLKAQGEPYLLLFPGHKYEQIAEERFTVRPDQPDE